MCRRSIPRTVAACIWACKPFNSTRISYKLFALHTHHQCVKTWKQAQLAFTCTLLPIETTDCYKLSIFPAHAPSNAWIPRDRHRLHSCARIFQLKPLTVITYNSLFPAHAPSNAWIPRDRYCLHSCARIFQLKPLTVISYLFSLHTHHPMRGCPETGTVCARYPLGGSSQVSWCLRSTCANDACIEKISRARTFWQLKKAHLQFFYALKAPVQIIRATEVLFRLHREMHRALSLLPRNKKNVSKL